MLLFAIGYSQKPIQKPDNPMLMNEALVGPVKK